MMDALPLDYLLMGFLFFAVAGLYSSVGHAGASGYSAVMALFNIAPVLMRPTSLMLNLVVGSIGLYRFHRAGFVNFKLVAPFLLASTPAAFWSAQLNISKTYFYLALGLVLLFSGLKLVLTSSVENSSLDLRKPPLLLSLLSGGVIGLFSGITGTGGAIFFTPLLLKMKWADAKSAAGLSIVFVLVNSIFGLAGIYSSSLFFELHWTLLWVVAVLVGALVGTQIGIFKFSNLKIQKMLGLVMLIAAVKLIAMGIRA